MKTRRFLFLSLAFALAMVAAVSANPPFVTGYVWNGSQCNTVTTLPDNCSTSNTVSICQVDGNNAYDSQANCNTHDGSTGILKRPN